MTLHLDLLEAIARRSGQPADACARALDAYLTVARAAIREGRLLRMPGIGEWHLAGTPSGTYIVAYTELPDELRTMTAEDLSAARESFDRHDVPDVHLHDPNEGPGMPQAEDPYGPVEFAVPHAAAATESPARREILPLPDMVLTDSTLRAHDAPIPDSDADRLFISGAVRRALAQQHAEGERMETVLDLHPMPPPELHDVDPDMAVPDMLLGVVPREQDLSGLDLRLDEDIRTGALPDSLLDDDASPVQPTMLPDVAALPVAMPVIDALDSLGPASEEELQPSTEVITSEDMESREFRKNREQLFHPPDAKRSGRATRIIVIVLTVLVVAIVLYMLYAGGSLDAMLPDQWHSPITQLSGDGNDAV